MQKLTRDGLVAGLVFTIALTLGLPARADAQYFGRNKVQYDKFEFKILDPEHFDIYYYPAEKADGRAKLAPHGERWYARLSQARSDHQLTAGSRSSSTPAIPDFEQTNVIEGELDEGTGGVTEGAQRRVVLPMAATLADTDHVLGHELVHAFQYDILGPNVEAPAAVVHRGHGRVPVARAARRADGDVAARRGDRGPAARRSRTSTTRATSRTASATRSGRTSAAGSATRRSSARSCWTLAPVERRATGRPTTAEVRRHRSHRRAPRQERRRRSGRRLARGDP